MQQIQITLLDELASFLKEKWGNLECKLIEIIVVEAYRGSKHLSSWYNWITWDSGSSCSRKSSRFFPIAAL